MRRRCAAIILIVFLFGLGSPAPRAYTLQHTDASASVRIKWPSNTIKVAFSNSLNSPPSNIKAGSDVVGALRRALRRWAEAADVEFVETSSSDLSISPGGDGDGVSLITVADTQQNRAVFDTADRTGRTRVFYDPNTGAIREADVVINPSAQFSTDGTTGTYDLESTFTHEVGHVLGLEHSNEAGSAMQPRQGINGLYEQAAVSPRTLSDDDRAGARALYGSRELVGAITGSVTDAGGAPAANTHVWAEEIKSGKVVAGSSSLADGSYHMEGLPPGEYRLVAEASGRQEQKDDSAFTKATGGAQSEAASESSVAEARGHVSVAAGGTARQDVALEKKTANTLDPQLFGSKGQLSTIAVPMTQGNRYTIFVGGAGLDQVKAGGISVTSPYIKVRPASLALQSGLNYEHPIISFEVEVSPEAPLGDYSIRLESGAGEVAYIPGALTVDAASGAHDPGGPFGGAVASAGSRVVVEGVLGSLALL